MSKIIYILVSISAIIFLFCCNTDSRIIENNGFFSLDGTNIYYHKTGQGSPLVILHGGPGLSHNYLYPQIRNLLSDNFQLIFYDQRASGMSTGREDTLDISIEQFVIDLERIRINLKLEKLNILGHSFGGLLAMYYASTYPTRTRSIVLLDSDAASWELRTPYQHKTIKERKTTEDLVESERIRISKKYQDQDPATVEAYFKIFLRTYFYNRSLADSLKLGFDAHSLKNLDITSKIVRQKLGKYDIHDRLQYIDCPTLIIHGDASIFSIEGAKNIHKFIDGSQLEIIKNCGHFAYIERPDKFVKLINTFYSQIESF